MNTTVAHALWNKNLYSRCNICTAISANVFYIFPVFLKGNVTVNRSKVMI